jgi:RNA polymerase sigma factor (sigma-70 family)
VTDPGLRRSKSVDGTLATPLTRSPSGVLADFEALYRSSRDDLYAYVATLLRDRSTAEDVTAAAFERAYRKRKSFNARRGNPRAWLFGIARNAALDELRRRSRQAPLTADFPDVEKETDDSAVPHDERRLALRAAVAVLEPRERDLIALKFHGGLTNAEIARVLGTSASNVGTLLHRAITKIRKALQ